MSALDTLIKVKKQLRNDDLIRILDEVTIYEKLSKSKALRDIKTASATRKKCPLLAAAYDGDLYALALTIVAGHIIAHLEQTILPIFIEAQLGLSPRERHRLEIMQNQIIPVTYASLMEYDHKTMESNVLAVYATEQETETSIVIIVRNKNEYVFYQGYFDKKEDLEVSDTNQPYVETREHGSLCIAQYSIQGNNAFPFATYQRGSKTYSVMLPNHETLWVFEDIEHPQEVHLSLGERNQLGFAKQHVETFASAILDILERVSFL